MHDKKDEIKVRYLNSLILFHGIYQLLSCAPFHSVITLEIAFFIFSYAESMYTNTQPHFPEIT